MTIKKIFAGLVALALSLGTAGVFAAGPLDLNPNDPDNFTRWAAGGQNIPFNPDQGGLAILDNPSAVAFVSNAFQVWEDVGTSTATYSNQGLMPFNVDVTNYAPFIFNLFFGTNTSDGLSPIVFDEDGSIFVDLFGPSGVLGFASADTFDANGVPIEGVAFLNGGAVLGGFPLFPEFFGVFVHEFGHYSGMAHTIVNGQAVALGDTSGPTPNNDFGPAPGNSVETMYPFLLGGGGQETLHADDVSFYSRLYPEAGFAANTVTITGSILGPNGVTPLTGVNVIARNVADPFGDAVSAISGDRGVTGQYTIDGLSPGADYVLFVDDMGPTQAVGGAFSTPGIALPGPEEYYNGANESTNGSTDVPGEFVALSGGAGTTLAGTNVLFNAPAPGVPLPLPDDGFVELFLPFNFNMCGADFESVFVNSNGSVTFGAGSSSFFESVSGLLGGPARIAPLWDDLNPADGGAVTFEIRDNHETFAIIYDRVPEFGFPTAVGENSFEVVIRSDNRFDVSYGDMTANDGLAGFSCGVFATSGFEEGTDLSAEAASQPVGTRGDTAVFEQFSFFGGSNDLDGLTLRYATPKDFRDRFESNESIRYSQNIQLPFDSIEMQRFTEIDRIYGSACPGHEDTCDVDYFWFNASAGELLTVDLFRGQIDSIIAIFTHDGELLALDDDGKGVVGGLSIIENFPVPADGEYVVAVSTWPDFDFDGIGGLGPEGRYLMDIFSVTPPPGDLLTLGDDDSEEVPLQFSFPYQGGSYDSIWVNSNGNVTFGSGDTDFSESVTEFLSDQPRIAPLWDDLSPNQGGFVSVLSEANQATVFFQDVPQFLAGDRNTFSVTLRSDGSITIDYGAVDATDGIVGVTPGGGNAGGPGAVDISSSPTWGATGSTYEQFLFGTFDLELSSTDYNP